MLFNKYLSFIWAPNQVRWAIAPSVCIWVVTQGSRKLSDFPRVSHLLICSKMLEGLLRRTGMPSALDRNGFPSSVSSEKFSPKVALQNSAAMSVGQRSGNKFPKFPHFWVHGVAGAGGGGARCHASQNQEASQTQGASTGPCCEPGAVWGRAITWTITFILHRNFMSDGVRMIWGRRRGRGLQTALV